MSVSEGFYYKIIGNLSQLCPIQQCTATDRRVGVRIKSLRKSFDKVFVEDAIAHMYAAPIVTLLA